MNSEELWLKEVWPLMVKRMLKELDEGCTKATVHGSSMMPRIQNGQTILFCSGVEKRVDDVVFCKVKGNYLVHKILKIDGDRYLIGNNKGRENGWTRQIYGVAIDV